MGDGNTVVKFGKLIIGKIIEISAIRCHILKLKCTNFDSGWGSADPAWESYSTPLVPLTGVKGPTSKVRKGRKDRKKGQGRTERRAPAEWPHWKQCKHEYSFAAEHINEHVILCQCGC